MTTSIYTSKRHFIGVLMIVLCFGTLRSQEDSTTIQHHLADSVTVSMNLDAVYNRPFLKPGRMPIAIGGYVEANSRYMGTNGVSEGVSFQLRRMTLFFSSSLHERIKFLSEIEFEDGTKEIALETAFMDVELDRLLTLRGGVIMNPIGAFNQNHDGPKWEFIDRPISATQLLPATWSNVGFGAHGKLLNRGWVFAYEAYLTNGFDDQIISNDLNKTYLPASKQNPDRFEESSNGVPLLTGKLAVKKRGFGEIGISYMGGVYNTFEVDGLAVDSKRRLDVVAVDFTTALPAIDTYITGEVAFIRVEVPETYTQQFGNRQWGGFVDLVEPVVTGSIFGFERSVLNLAARVEYVDWNVGTFNETGGNIGEDVFAIIPAMSWRPTAQTVMRLNYRYEWQHDLLGNPPAKTAGFQFGISTYF